MMIKELVILRYIDKKKAVTEKQLSKKFSDLYTYYKWVKDDYECIREESAGAVFNKIMLKIRRLSGEETVLILTFKGLDEVLKYKRERNRFVIPYIITTGIAFSSIIVQFLNFGYAHPDFAEKVISFFGWIAQWIQRLIPF